MGPEQSPGAVHESEEGLSGMRKVGAKPRPDLEGLSPEQPSFLLVRSHRQD